MTHPAQHRPRRSLTWQRLAALAGAASLVAAATLFLAPSASAAAAEAALNTSATAYVNENVQICHRTDAASNPYVSEGPNINALINSSHPDHAGPVWSATLAAGTDWGDIIPAFYYKKNKNAAVVEYFSGRNWDADGKAIWDANCVASGTPAPTEPALTLVKTASPTEFSKAGETITYTFTVTNTGDVDLSDVNVTDAWTASAGSGSITGLTCPASTLAKGAHMDCAATYTTTDDDVAAGKPLINTAFATAKASGDVRSNDDTATVTPVASVKVDKIWEIDGKTYLVSVDSPPAGYDAVLSIPGIATPDWATEYHGFTVGDAISVGETATVPDECTYSAVTVGPTTLATGLNTFTITNTVTCTDDDDTPPGGGGTPPAGGGTPPADGGTPPVPVAEVLPEVEEVPTPTVEVQGESQEVLAPAPAIEVAGVSREVPAPSANAHTGQGTTPWVYALLATGLVLMLGAAGVRRRDQA
jgi:uncharacterized repeat protein (TIGR01451 family)